MEDKDIKNIKYLIKNYSIKEILSEMNISLLDEADYLSDLGLKERSLDCIESHEIISSILEPKKDVNDDLLYIYSVFS